MGYKVVDRARGFRCSLLEDGLVGERKHSTAAVQQYHVPTSLKVQVCKHLTLRLCGACYNKLNKAAGLSSHRSFCSGA